MLICISQRRPRTPAMRSSERRCFILIFCCTIIGKPLMLPHHAAAAFLIFCQFSPPCFDFRLPFRRMPR